MGNCRSRGPRGRFICGAGAAIGGSAPRPAPLLPAHVDRAATPPAPAPKQPNRPPNHTTPQRAAPSLPTQRLAPHASGLAFKEQFLPAARLAGLHPDQLALIDFLVLVRSRWGGARRGGGGMGQVGPLHEAVEAAAEGRGVWGRVRARGGRAPARWRRRASGALAGGGESTRGLAHRSPFTPALDHTEPHLRPRTPTPGRSWDSPPAPSASTYGSTGH